jgi:hypothetical protein
MHVGIVSQILDTCAQMCSQYKPVDSGGITQNVAVMRAILSDGGGAAMSENSLVSSLMSTSTWTDV